MILLQSVTVQLSVKDESNSEVFNYKAELEDKEIAESEADYKQKVQEIVDFVLYMMNDFKDTSCQPRPSMSEFSLVG